MERRTKSKKREAVLICGFSNWGKSTIISNLFDRSRFYYGSTYSISGVNFATEFTVESQSNDDLHGQRWLDRIEERLGESPDNGQFLFSALCPSMETHNNFIRLLNDPMFRSCDQVHIFLIEFKWEHHAKLLIKNIITEGSQIRNANFIVIDADRNANAASRLTAKLAQIRLKLNQIF